MQGRLSLLLSNKHSIPSVAESNSGVLVWELIHSAHTLHLNKQQTSKKTPTVIKAQVWGTNYLTASQQEKGNLPKKAFSLLSGHKVHYFLFHWSQWKPLNRHCLGHPQGEGVEHFTKGKG